MVGTSENDFGEIIVPNGGGCRAGTIPRRSVDIRKIVGHFCFEDPNDLPKFKSLKEPGKQFEYRRRVKNKENEQRKTDR